MSVILYLAEISQPNVFYFKSWKTAVYSRKYWLQRMRRLLIFFQHIYSKTAAIKPTTFKFNLSKNCKNKILRTLSRLYMVKVTYLLSFEVKFNIGLCLSAQKIAETFGTSNKYISKFLWRYSQLILVALKVLDFWILLEKTIEEHAEINCFLYQQQKSVQCFTDSSFEPVAVHQCKLSAACCKINIKRKRLQHRVERGHKVYNREQKSLVLQLNIVYCSCEVSSS